MSAALLVAALVCATGFLLTVRRNERLDVPVRALSRAALVEGLWLAPAIGCALAGLVAMLGGRS